MWVDKFKFYTIIPIPCKIPIWDLALLAGSTAPGAGWLCNGLRDLISLQHLEVFLGLLFYICLASFKISCGVNLDLLIYVLMTITCFFKVRIWCVPGLVWT